MSDQVGYSSNSRMLLIWRASTANNRGLGCRHKKRPSRPVDLTSECEGGRQFFVATPKSIARHKEIDKHAKASACTFHRR